VNAYHVLITLAGLGGFFPSQAQSLSDHDTQPSEATPPRQKYEPDHALSMHGGDVAYAMAHEAHAAPWWLEVKAPGLEYVWRHVKFESTASNNRPSESPRGNFDLRTLDSAATRLLWNPAPGWALQISHEKSGSALEWAPDISLRRSSVSASYSHHFGTRRWQTTLAWRRNRPQSGQTSAGWLLESEWRASPQSILFGRAERVDNNDLFKQDERAYGQTARIGKFSVGAIHDINVGQSATIGVGVLASRYAMPAGLAGIYGAHPRFYMVFIQARFK